MADRGNCKFFVPNYFNPTKCQNCFKQKDQHTNQEAASGTNKPALSRKGSVKTPAKTILKESFLLKGIPSDGDKKPETWRKYWYRLYSTGELQEFNVEENGQVSKENPDNCIMLQDYIRMLDGRNEIAEDLCFGVKALRDIVYFKTLSKVDFENWWKEFSTFIIAPLRRTTSSASSMKSATSFGRAQFTKQYSLPASQFVGKSMSRSSRSSSISSLHSDTEQMETLRVQVNKLEDENKKLAKCEAERRKLELEVNYWKEYVTNAQTLKRTGSNQNLEQELADARRKIIHMQDELNECQKKLKHNTGKLLLQNKDVADLKEKLHEANSITAVYKAKIDLLHKELSQKDQVKSLALSKDEILISTVPHSTPKLPGSPELSESPVSGGSSTNSGLHPQSEAQHLEDKFLLLKDKLKRIEKELYLKSKELEKANESRSKVAKYTRSLLQELESRLSESQQKLSDAEEKLKNTKDELTMERERRMKLEDGPRRRMSSVISPSKIPTQGTAEENSQSSDLTEHDAETKYADYYRSRYKQAESALLEKDKKLHQAEEKIKQIQQAMKHNTESQKVINDLQSKLSDATHKLSDRQLKMHELQRDVERLKGFEKTYERKTKQCETLEEMVKDLEKKNKEQANQLFQTDQELELIKIREVVTKEQLQTFLEDSDNTDDEEDDDEKIIKALDLKKKIENFIETEALSKKLTSDNAKLQSKIYELEQRLKNINIQNFKTLKSCKNTANNEQNSKALEKEELEIKIKDLEALIAIKDEKYCNELTISKEKYKEELNIALKNKENEIVKLKNELTTKTIENSKIIDDSNELKGKITMLNISLTELKEKLDVEKSQHTNFQTLLSEKTNLVQEMEERCKLLTNERNALKEELKNRRNSFAINSATDNKLITEKEEKIERLNSENEELKMKERRLERQLRMSLERMEDLICDVKEKGYKLDGWEKDRDSGIVIPPNEREYARYDSEIEVFMTPRGSQSSEADIDKYKHLCSNFQCQLKALSEKFISSEKQVLKLASELEQHTKNENEYVAKYENIEKRMEEIQQQLHESHDSLLHKSEELEKERKSVINLVEVTSDYIKELETSLSESKSKVQELQKIVQLNKENDRSPPDGSSEETIDETKRRSESDDSEDVNTVRKKLTAKIMVLQSDISELKSSHSQEIKQLAEDSKKQLEQLRNRMSSSAFSEESEELVARIETLEKELTDQKEEHSKEITILQQHFQQELKAAFSGDTGGIDMLNRVQELEIEIENTRKDCEMQLKEMQEVHENEKQQMKDDMATVLQASLSASFSEGISKSEDEPRSATVEELEERIIKLETDLVEMKTKYEEELEMEKEAHQREMEDTIRDMMMVRDAMGGDDDDDVDQTNGISESHEVPVNTKNISSHENKKADSVSNISTDRIRVTSASQKNVSIEELDNIKQEYEKKLQTQSEEHESEINQIRSDYAIVIASLKRGDSSETIVEFQARVQDLEKELEDLKVGFANEREELESKIKRTESSNFYNLRRIEEMSTKIYSMQVELEELDGKHALEIQAYQDKLSSLGCDVENDDVGSTLRLNEELNKKLKDLEEQLNERDNHHNEELERITLKLEDEKRKSVQKLTDKVLQLESLIDSMEQKHKEELREYDDENRDQKLEIVVKQKERIDELEDDIEKLKTDYKSEIESLTSEHKREVEKLRLFYEKEIGDIKKRTASDSSESFSRRVSVVESTHNKMRELKEKHEKEIENLRLEFSNEKEELQKRQEHEIADIRTQYDEKLKFSYKEGLRRQSVSERKSDATRMRELIAEKETATTKLLELEIKYDKDITELNEKIETMQKFIDNMTSSSSADGSEGNISQTNTSTNELADDETQKKLNEIQDQIERYERRIEYYREKSQRENCEESHRISELQSDIVDLHKEIDSIKENKRRQIYDREKKERDPSIRKSIRRNTDGSAQRRPYTDTTVGAKTRINERDTRKRWSNLEERTEVITRNIAELDGKRNPRLSTALKKDEGKSGTVLARKTLWESITDEPESISQKSTSLTRIPSQVK